MKLHLGCGSIHMDGFVNIDYVPGPAVDLVWDMSWPLPYGDGTVEHIFTSHALEHLLDWEKCVRECHRVLRPGGMLEVIVPYMVQPAAGHRAIFGPRSFDAFLTDDSTGNDAAHLFDLYEFKTYRRFPWSWHVQHYLGVKMSERNLIGPKHELHWKLTKSEEVRQVVE